MQPYDNINPTNNAEGLALFALFVLERGENAKGRLWVWGGEVRKREETQQQPDERYLTASTHPSSATTELKFQGDPEETTEEVAAVCVQHMAACEREREMNNAGGIEAWGPGGGQMVVHG